MSRDEVNFQKSHRHFAGGLDLAADHLLGACWTPPVNGAYVWPLIF